MAVAAKPLQGIGRSRGQRLQVGVLEVAGASGSVILRMYNHRRIAIMQTARLFINGNSQAFRLPKEFRFEGDEVVIKKVGNARTAPKTLRVCRSQGFA